MASTQEILAPELYWCYHCGFESTESSFKYFDNKKADQPRHQCHHCHKLFTLGSHGRPQGKTYAKKRNEDPAKLKNLSRQCRHCGVADNALFKYYNNNNLSQPRFQCLSCRKQFQMRLLGTGEGRRLVHTSSQPRSAPRRPKQGVPEPFPYASSNSEDGIYQPSDGSFMPVPSDQLMPLESGAMLVRAETSDEDAQYSDFLESELLADGENTVIPNADDPISWTGNGDDRNLPPPLSDKAAEYLHFLEAELLTGETNEAPNANALAFSTTANVNGALPLGLSNEDAELMDFMEADLRDNWAPHADMVSDNMAEMISESSSNNAEVMYGTLVVESPAASDSDSWSQNDPSVDPSSMSYADAAAAFCHQMDMKTARANSMLPVASVQPIGSECSSSSACSTIVFGDPFRVIPEPHLSQQALTEDEQCSDFHWNEGDEAEDDMEMAPGWVY